MIRPVTKNDIPDMAAFMADLWNLIKKYYNAEHDDDLYWESYINESDLLAKKYKEDDLVVQLLLGLTTYLDRKANGKSGKVDKV